MNIKTIHLENWKKFINPVEIQLEEGINVLYGPNESGKTTLIDSIITTFYSKHTSNSQKIKSLKPWGTSLHPRSSITFTKNNHQYRITKGFHEKKSLLEKMDQGSWIKIAEGDQADKKLIQLVGGQIAPRGDTKPEYWGLGQSLWMVQGNPIIQEELNDETVSSMQKMVNATIESDDEKKVLREIRSRFMENFSPVKKELKKKSQLGRLKDEINSLKSELDLSNSKIRKKETLIRSLEDNQILVEKIQGNLETAKKEKTQLEREVEEAHEHQRNREKLENEIEKLKKEFESSKERSEEIEKAKSEIKRIIESNNAIKLRLEPLKAELDKLNKKMDDDNTAIRNLDEQINIHLDEKKNSRHCPHCGY
ncbi:MAG: AAA family ATPase [Methanobacteriaceae archaeon]|nr:AAA family ATPase [Methanobacteriaceae archaeon]